MTSFIDTPLQRTSSVPKTVATLLSPVVLELTALSVNGKQAHWLVRGPAFQDVHELLDEVVAHAREWADLAAERVVALGEPVDGRVQTVAENTKTAELAPGFQSIPATVAAIVAEIDQVLDVVRAAITGLDEDDLASQDVVIEIERGLVKDRWFLASHVLEA